MPGIFVNVFIYPFLDHIQSSRYYWHGGSFKVPHFRSFNFPSLWIYLLLKSFSHQPLLMVFHSSLGDKTPQVSRTLLSILAVINNAVVWMVSTRPPTSNWWTGTAKSTIQQVLFFFFLLLLGLVIWSSGRD